MSLITDGEGGHRGGPGLPLGMRTDGIFFLPHMPAKPAVEKREPETAAIEEMGQSVPMLQTVAGPSDRVYFLVGKGVVKPESLG